MIAIFFLWYRDATKITVPDALYKNGEPSFTVSSFHHNSWWGPLGLEDSRFFKYTRTGNTLHYLMSDVWSPGSFDDAAFAITVKHINPQ